MAREFSDKYRDSMEPKYSFAAGRMGVTTNPTVAKQLEEFSSKLNEGVKNIEVGTLNPTTFETIPMEHFDEIKRLAKLTEAEVSLHAPLLDISGFGGGGEGQGEPRWSKEQRIQVEQQVVSIMERANKMSPNGNIPIVIHAGNMTAQEYDKSLNDQIPKRKLVEQEGRLVPEEVYDSKGKPVYQPGVRKMTIVNPESGKIGMVDFDWKYSPGKKDQDMWDPWKRLYNMNVVEWDEEKLKVFEKLKVKEELAMRYKDKERQNIDIMNAGMNTGEYDAYNRQFETNNLEMNRIQQHMDEIDTKTHSEISELHNKIKSFMPSKDDPNYKVYKEQLDEYEKIVDNNAKERGRLMKKYSDAYHNATTDDARKEAGRMWHRSQTDFDDAVRGAISKIKAPPQLWQPVGEFAIGKAAETVANSLFQFHVNNPNIPLDKLPIIAMENFSPNTAISSASELKKTIGLARGQFVDMLVKERKINRKEAEKAANKVIGATWDVGHINLLRKAGYSEKEMQKIGVDEVKKIAKDVRHLHLTDNFGFHDSHLAPGMGNVPIKKVMEELERQGFSGRAIIEAGALINEFGMSPTHHMFEQFNSPMYKMGASPYWQHEKWPSYGTSYVELPQQHFNLYGSGFSTLPTVLGGQVGEDKGRFSGAPNA